MTIKANILAVKKKIQDEMSATPGHSDTADRLKRKGLDAIMGGAPAWVSYMKEFAGKPENPTELARLIPTDGTDNQDDMNDARAYLVANGPCGVETVNKLEVGVTDLLDQ